MVELVVFKVPDGTKDVLKELAAKRGYMGLSDFLRDLVRRELRVERDGRKAVKTSGPAVADAASNVSELGAPNDKQRA